MGRYICSYGGSGEGYCYMDIFYKESNTIFWYQWDNYPQAQYQCNLANIEYNYLAFY